MDEVRELAAHQPTPLSLRQMKSFAAAGDKLRLVSASFLHNELQIRFARYQCCRCCLINELLVSNSFLSPVCVCVLDSAIMELSDLPIGLSKTSSVQKAIDVYCNELKLLKSMDPPSTSEEDVAFTDAIKKAKGRGTNLVPLICSGLQEIKATDLGSNALQLESVQEDIMHRLDTFFLSRIGIRMLIGQHVESLDQVGGRVELVNVEATVRSACQRAAKLCKKYKGQAPEVEIRLAANTSAPFIYIESHLHHMVFEIVKNSMRATVEYHEGLQLKKPGRLNRLENVMNPTSKQLGFVLPAVSLCIGSSHSSEPVLIGYDVMMSTTDTRSARRDNLPGRAELPATGRAAADPDRDLAGPGGLDDQGLGRRRGRAAFQVVQALAL